MRIWGTALALALMVACNGDDPAPPTPSPTVTSASASPSADPAAEAEAAVRAYYAETTIAFGSGNVGRLRSLSVPTCPCRDVASSIEKSWANGSMRGGVYTIRSARIDAVSLKAATVTVTYDLTALQELDRSGRVTRTAPAIAGASAQLDLVRESDRWLVARIVRLGAPT